MPKGKSDQFKCAVCGKTYKTEAWYQKHILNHEVRDDTSGSTVRTSYGNEEGAAPVEETNQNEEEEVAAAISADWDANWSGTDDDEEAESYLIMDPVMEEVEEELRRAALAGEAEVDMAPKHTQKKTALVKCSNDSCNASFLTMEGYVKHRVTHGMQAALLQLPDFESLLKECPRLANAALEDLEKSKLRGSVPGSTSSLACQLKDFCDSEVMSKFFNILCTALYGCHPILKDCSTPSCFAVSYYENSSKVMIDIDLKDELRRIILTLVEFPDNICNVFLTNFIQMFSNKLLSHLLHVIGGNENSLSLNDRYAKTQQSTESIDFKQNMHFIGGSNVKSVLKNALRIKHRTEEWQRVISTIREKFLINELANAPDKELMAWTEAVDRGKLIKISAAALDFFVQLGREVKPLERLDGSIINDEVITTVSNSPALLLRWDLLKGGLNERESFKLLHALTSYFCITWRNGIIGRRDDERAKERGAQKFGTAGVSFRAKLV